VGGPHLIWGRHNTKKRVVHLQDVTKRAINRVSRSVVPLRREVGFDERPDDEIGTTTVRTITAQFIDGVRFVTRNRNAHSSTRNNYKKCNSVQRVRIFGKTRTTMEFENRVRIANANTDVCWIAVVTEEYDL